MLGLLYRLLIGSFGCRHKWLTIETRNVNDGGVLIGQKFNCICEKCGSHKTFKSY